MQSSPGIEIQLLVIDDPLPLHVHCLPRCPCQLHDMEKIPLCQATYCKKCDIIRPERAHHCHFCRKCVLRLGDLAIGPVHDFFGRFFQNAQDFTFSGIGKMYQYQQRRISTIHAKLVHVSAFQATAPYHVAEISILQVPTVCQSVLSSILGSNKEDAIEDDPNHFPVSCSVMFTSSEP